jgi:hypothetical protein
MKLLWQVSISLIVPLVALFYLHQPADDPNSQFAGTWEGTMNGLPAVEIKLTDHSGKVDGTIAFYLQMRGEEAKWRVMGDKASAVQPLLSPYVNGNVLTFEVTHHKTHGSAEFGPNKRFRIAVTSSTTAYLRTADADSNPPPHGLKLVRTGSWHDPSPHQVRFIRVQPVYSTTSLGD